MANNSYKSRASALVSKAKEKKLIKKYSDFCDTEVAKNNCLVAEEISYYISKNKKEEK